MLGISSPFAESIPGQSGSAFLFTDNSNYYAVGTQKYIYSYLHEKITNIIFYQLKNIITDCVSSISEKDKVNKQVTIFPNPAMEWISIYMNIDKKSTFNLSLINTQEQKIYTEVVDFASTYKLNVNMPVEFMF